MTELDYYDRSLLHLNVDLVMLTADRYHARAASWLAIRYNVIATSFQKIVTSFSIYNNVFFHCQIKSFSDLK